MLLGASFVWITRDANVTRGRASTGSNAAAYLAGDILTGPSVVDRSNLAQVEALAMEHIR